MLYILPPAPGTSPLTRFKVQYKNNISSYGYVFGLFNILLFELVIFQKDTLSILKVHIEPLKKIIQSHLNPKMLIKTAPDVQFSNMDTVQFLLQVQNIQLVFHWLTNISISLQCQLQCIKLLYPVRFSGFNSFTINCVH